MVVSEVVRGAIHDYLRCLSYIEVGIVEDEVRVPGVDTSLLEGVPYVAWFECDALRLNGGGGDDLCGAPCLVCMKEGIAESVAEAAELGLVDGEHQVVQRLGEVGGVRGEEVEVDVAVFELPQHTGDSMDPEVVTVEEAVETWVHGLPKQIEDVHDLVASLRSSM